MRIFKAHYLPKDTIYQILGKVESDIREAYTGGAVDVYIPHNGDFNNFFSNSTYKLYYYDCNSMYPAVMSRMPLPVGKPIAFEGDIRKVEGNNAYGFFYCKISCPTHLQEPILQRRLKIDSGVRTIAGVGNWEGWVFSEEMYNAMKLGYRFKVF